MKMRILPWVMGLVLVALSVAPALAASPAPLTITSSIAPGVVIGPDGFGSSTVVVPAGEKITFLATTTPPLPGRRIEIWTKSSTTDWRLTTARISAADGSIHYFATVTGWTAFLARFPGDAGTVAASSHGRIAVASATGLTAIGVICDEFAAASGGAIGRHVVVRTGELVAVTLCSNASTGFSWQPPTFASANLKLVGHATRAPANPLPGAAGTETFTFRILHLGASAVSLSYSQPWAGGQKAAWRFSLAINAMRPGGFVCSPTFHLAGTAAPEPLAALTGVRVGAHPGYDRVVFEFAGSGTPVLDLARATPPFVQDASGMPVLVRGNAFLRLVLRGASGAGTYAGPVSFGPGGQRLTSLVNTGDFEGVLSWVAGMTGPACYRVSTLAKPARIVVDVLAP